MFSDLMIKNGFLFKIKITGLGSKDNLSVSLACFNYFTVVIFQEAGLPPITKGGQSLENWDSSNVCIACSISSCFTSSLLSPL